MKKLLFVFSCVVLFTSCSKKDSKNGRDIFLGNYNFTEFLECVDSICGINSYSEKYIVGIVAGVAENAVIIKNLHNNLKEYKATVNGNVLFIDAGENTFFTAATIENDKLKFNDYTTYFGTTLCCTHRGEGTKF